MDVTNFNYDSLMRNQINNPQFMEKLFMKKPMNHCKSMVQGRSWLLGEYSLCGSDWSCSIPLAKLPWFWCSLNQNVPRTVLQPLIHSASPATDLLSWLLLLWIVSWKRTGFIVPVENICPIAFMPSNVRWAVKMVNLHY